MLCKDHAIPAGAKGLPIKGSNDIHFTRDAREMTSGLILSEGKIATYNSKQERMNKVVIG